MTTIIYNSFSKELNPIKNAIDALVDEYVYINTKKHPISGGLYTIEYYNRFFNKENVSDNDLNQLNLKLLDLVQGIYHGVKVLSVRLERITGPIEHPDWEICIVS